MVGRLQRMFKNQRYRLGAKGHDLSYTSLSIFDQGRSYFVQWLTMVCTLQCWFQITDTTLELNIKYIKIRLTTYNANSFHFLMFDVGCSYLEQ